MNEFIGTDECEEELKNIRNPNIDEFIEMIWSIKYEIYKMWFC